MAYRLTRIVTRSGDNGTTSLADGSRTVKESPRIEAIGTIDELNSLLGLTLAHGLPTEIEAVLVSIQHWLFEIGGELAFPGRTVLQEERVLTLEAELMRLNAALPPLREFILPGGTRASALCHVARAVCRRAERRLWVLSREEKVNPTSLRFMNRLSDLLFVMARTLVLEESRTEVQWQNPAPKP